MSALVTRLCSRASGIINALVAPLHSPVRTGRSFNSLSLSTRNPLSCRPPPFNQSMFWRGICCELVCRAWRVCLTLAYQWTRPASGLCRPLLAAASDGGGSGNINTSDHSPNRADHEATVRIPALDSKLHVKTIGTPPTSTGSLPPSPSPFSADSAKGSVELINQFTE